MTCLILRADLKTPFRGIIEILITSGGLRRRMGIEQLTHYSTLKKFADRGDTFHLVDYMLLEIVQHFDQDAEETLTDSTGIETASVSAHYLSCRGKQCKKFIKVSVCVIAG